MRVREGDFAYDIEPVYDRASLVRTGWKYGVYALRPERKLTEGTAATREQAEQEAVERVEEFKRERRAA